MPKKLPLSDLRARRSYLINADYALAEGDEYKPSGHINKKVWQSLVGPSDNVLLQTTDAFSRALKTIDAMAYSWLDINDKFQNTSPLYEQTLSALECFQGAAFNAASGWYRIAGIVLRCALEDVLLGLYYETRPYKKHDFDAIVRGERGSPAMRTILAGIEANHPTTAERIREAEELYGELSIYVHRIANSFIWESNGPVFVGDAFERLIEQMDKTYRILCDVIEIVVPGTGADAVANSVRFKKRSDP